MAKEHRMHDVVGCVYPSPVPDDGLKLPERNEDLRAFQLREMCPKLVGLPVYMSHLTTPREGFEYSSTDNPALGQAPLGKVVDSWIDPDTGAMHWRGTLVARRDGPLDQCLAAGKAFTSCSLSHYPADNSSSAKPVEISVCSNPLRPGSIVQYTNVLDYMRKYNHPCHSTTPKKPKSTLIMASNASDPSSSASSGAGAPAASVPATPAAAAPSAPVTDPVVQQSPQQTPEQIDQESLLNRADAEIARLDQMYKKQAAEMEKLKSVADEYDKIISQTREEAISVIGSIIGEQNPLKQELVKASASRSQDVKTMFSVIKEMAKFIKSSGIDTAGESTATGAQQPATRVDKEIASAVRDTRNGCAVPLSSEAAIRLAKRLRGSHPGADTAVEERVSKRLRDGYPGGADVDDRGRGSGLTVSAVEPQIIRASGAYASGESMAATETRPRFDRSKALSAIRDSLVDGINEYRVGSGPTRAPTQSSISINSVDSTGFRFQ